MALRILIFVIYTIVYFFLAMMSTGGGHGNFIFLAPLFTWIFPFAAICLSTKLSNKTIRIVFVLLLLVHYFVVGLNIYEYLQSKYWQKDYIFWEKNFFLQVFLMALYFAGQAYIWSLFFRKGNLVKEETKFLS